jgi:hypothetical protein
MPDGKQDSFILTYPGGMRLHAIAPKFDLNDTGHALSMLCRFVGHVRKFYCVAEHSMLVAWLIDRLAAEQGWTATQLLRREALLHDATESAIGDIASPFKRVLPDYKALEAGMELELRAQYGLPLEQTPAIKYCDWVALHMEASKLTADGGACFADPLGVRATALVLAKEWVWPMWAPGACKSLFVQCVLDTYDRRD